ncbi:MAG: molybdopterin molybdotransferase MoeA [Cyclobacteriaceae bacterium]|nr:molybdopterin molybdotransferase MoeA [Cyclobacteriaceae bacterium]
MVSVSEATVNILSQLYKPSIETVTITDAPGRVLAENVLADRDFPPFDRVSMDGVAIRFNEWKRGQRSFGIEDVQAAGSPAGQLRHAQCAVEVMTGAVLPEGTDTVIRYEDLTIHEDQATIQTMDVKQGQSIHRQGQDALQGDVLLEPGIILSPAEIALLASVGKSEVKVYAFPKTAIVASGDELVEIDTEPEPHQIRRSNTYAIQAAMKVMGWEGTQFHLMDDKNVLVDSLRMITASHDVVILSGGISKGKFDFIPDVLEEIGVKKVFQFVRQRPGKPFWFGVSDSGKIVFALPGNPVSTYLCFYRYVRPWLLSSLHVALKSMHAILARDFEFEPDLTYFLQVSVRNEMGKLMAYPDSGGGSGDFANLKKVDGFLELPSDRSTFKAGEAFPFIPFRLAN